MSLRHTFLCATSAFLLLAFHSCTLLPLIHAQARPNSTPPCTHTATPPPRAVWAPSHAVLNNKLYIQGGQAQDLSYLGQFYALDLSVSWETRCPAWEQLADGPKNFYHSSVAVVPRARLGTSMGLYAPPSMATVLRYPPSGVENSNNISHKDEVVGEEKGGILTFKATVDAPNLINRYDIVSNFWTLSPSTIKVLVPRRYGIEAVTDPRSGLVYLLGGYHSWLLDSMAVYNPYMDVMATKPLVQEPGHQEAEVAGLAFFSAAWVPNLSSVLYMGGKSDLYPDRTTAKVALYSPQEDRWTSVITTGDVPQDMDGACLAIDVVRRQAILFGGSGHFQDSNQISFLNLNTTSHTAFCWRRGRHAQQSRRNMACAAQGRFFVVWGGKVNNTIGDFQSPMVYDLIKDQWVDRYDPSL